MLLNRIRELVGLQIRILTPEEEARYSYRGAICGLKLPSGITGLLNLQLTGIDAVMGEGENIRQFTQNATSSICQTHRCGSAIELTDADCAGHPRP